MSGLSHPSIKIEDGLVRIWIPMILKRQVGRKLIIVPWQDGGNGQSPDSNGTIARTIARAHHWQQLFEEGQFRSISGFAREIGVNNSYVHRMFRLALLAPDIVAAILRSGEPVGISIYELMRAPILWDEQRKRMEFF